MPLVCPREIRLALAGMRSGSVGSTFESGECAIVVQHETDQPDMCTSGGTRHLESDARDLFDVPAVHARADGGKGHGAAFRLVGDPQ